MVKLVFVLLYGDYCVV